VQQEGLYRFFLQCEDRCSLDVNRVPRCRSSDEKFCLAGMHRDSMETSNIMLTRGWHKVSSTHVALLSHPSRSFFQLQYRGPDTSNRMMTIPEERLRAGITRQTIEQLDRHNQRETITRSSSVLVPARELFSASRQGYTSCPGSRHPKLVEFFCQVAPDMEPGYYNLRFHDHQFGESVEGRSSLFAPGMGSKRASVLIVPLVKSLEQFPDGSLLVQGAGLDRMGTNGSLNDS